MSLNQKPLEGQLEMIRVATQKDLVSFAIATNRRYTPNWHHEVIAGKLKDVLDGKIKRLMIFVPPRHGKSELASVIFPAWFLGKHPEKEIIMSSYSAELAQDFGRKTRDLVNLPEYGVSFDTKLREDSQSKAKWLTKEGGGYTAVGVGGAITGRGANILLIDDPVKNREEAESDIIREKVWSWYTSTAYTRLEKDGAIILIMTRWHMDDLAGRLIKNMEEGGEQWDIVKFPAIATEDEQFRKMGEPIWEEKYDLKSLETIKTAIGTYDWLALYQQTPTASDGIEFKPDFFQYRTLGEVIGKMTNNYLTVDTAISQRASADFTGFCLNMVDTENKWNLLAWHAKLTPKELIDNLFALQQKYNLTTIGIEKTIYLQAIKPFLDDEMRRRNIFLNIQELDHQQRAKEIRIRGLIPRYESKSIYHIKGEVKDLEEEMMQFPKGHHDDVIDAAAYQLQIAEQPLSYYNLKTSY